MDVAVRPCCCNCHDVAKFCSDVSAVDMPKWSANDLAIFDTVFDADWDAFSGPHEQTVGTAICDSDIFTYVVPIHAP
jgi:hypothetical protein